MDFLWTYDKIQIFTMFYKTLTFLVLSPVIVFLSQCASACPFLRAFLLVLFSCMGYSVSGSFHPSGLNSDPKNPLQSPRLTRLPSFPMYSLSYHYLLCFQQYLPLFEIILAFTTDFFFFPFLRAGSFLLFTVIVLGTKTVPSHIIRYFLDE